MIRIEDFAKVAKEMRPKPVCKSFVLAENSNAGRDVLCHLPQGHRDDHEERGGLRWLNTGRKRNAR